MAPVGEVRTHRGQVRKIHYPIMDRRLHERFKNFDQTALSPSHNFCNYDL